MSLAPSTYDEVKATRKMRWWYEALADFMIAHPAARQNDIAAYFKRSPGTISLIINSDAFQAYLRKRRGEYQGALETTVRDKMLNVAEKSFDMILERFEKKRDTIPLETIHKSAELAMKGLGMGIEQRGPQVVVQQNAAGPIPVAVSLDDLQDAQKALRASQMAPLIEHQPAEPASPDSNIIVEDEE